MSKQKIIAVRQSKSVMTRKTVKFSQVQLSKEADYCHRDNEVLKEENVEGLMRNIVSSGGIRTPFLVAEASVQGKDVEEAYILVGGRRRYEAIRSAIGHKYEQDIFHDDMEVPVTVMRRAEDQSPEDFERELFLSSVADNDQRKDFSAAERFRIVTRMLEKEVLPGRAAMEMGLSRTQYERLEIVANHAWLREAVIDNCITHTDAATILEACKIGERTNRQIEDDRVEKFQQHFESWVWATKAKIDEYVQHQKGIDKKVTDSQKHVKSRLTRSLISHWCECLRDGNDLSNVTPNFYRIDFDDEKRVITLPKREFKIDKLSVHECRTIIRQLNGSVDRFLEVLKQRQAIEAARNPISKDDREAALERIMAEEPSSQTNEGSKKIKPSRAKVPVTRDVVTDDEDGAV